LPAPDPGHKNKFTTKAEAYGLDIEDPDTPDIMMEMAGPADDAFNAISEMDLGAEDIGGEPDISDLAMDDLPSIDDEYGGILDANEPDTASAYVRQHTRKLDDKAAQGRGIIGTLMDGLQWWENARVGVVRGALGLQSARPVKFKNQTFEDMLVNDFGMEKSGITTAAAFLADTVMAPETYLSFGLSTVGKGARLGQNAVKGIFRELPLSGNAFLKKDGSLIINELGRRELREMAENAAIEQFGEDVIKKNASEAEAFMREFILKEQEKIVPQLASANDKLSRMNKIGLTHKGAVIFRQEVGDRLAGKFTPDVLEKGLAKEIVAQTEDEVLGVLDDIATSAKIVDDAVAGRFLDKKTGEISKGLIDAGGIKVYVPFTKIERTIVSGEKIKNIVNSSGLPGWLSRQASAGTLVGRSAEYLDARWFDMKTYARKTFGGNALNITDEAIEQRLKVAAVDGYEYAERVAQRGVKISDQMLAENAETFIFNLSKHASQAARKHYEKVVGEEIGFFKELSGEQKVKFVKAMVGHLNVERGRGVKADFDITKMVDDPVVQKKINEWKARSPQLAEEAGLTVDEHYANYLPFLNKGAVDSYIRKAKDGKILGDRLRLAERDYLIEAKTRGEQVYKSPAALVTALRSQIMVGNIRDEIVMKTAREFGKVFNNPFEARRQGYISIMGEAEETARWELLSRKTQNVAKGLAKELGTDSVNKIYIPNRVHKSLQENKYLQRYSIPLVTAFTNKLKYHLTVPFPAFTARNAISNTVLNAANIGLHAVSPKKNKMAIDAILGRNLDNMITNDAGEKFTLGQLLDDAKSRGLIGDAIHDMPKALMSPNESFAAKAKAAVWALNPLAERGYWGRMMQHMSRSVENQARFTNYLYWRMAGLDGKFSAQQALDTLFDYGKVTKAESVIKHLIPFYSFSRNNIENNWKLFKQRPGVIAGRMKFWNHFGPNEEEFKNLPDWAKKKFTLAAGKMIYSFGADPLEDISELTSGAAAWVGRVHPAIKYMVESGLDKDAFAGRRMVEFNRANELGFILNAAKGRGITRGVPGAQTLAQSVAEWLDLRRADDRVVANPTKLHIMRSLFTSRYLSTLGLASKEDVDMSMKLARILTGATALTPNDPFFIYLNNVKTVKDLGVDRLVGQGMFTGGDFPRANKSAFKNPVKRTAANKLMRELFERARESGYSIDEERVHRTVEKIEKLSSIERP